MTVGDDKGNANRRDEMTTTTKTATTRTATMTRQVTKRVGGHEFTLTEGRRYLASRPMATNWATEYPVRIDDITDGISSAPPAAVTLTLTIDGTPYSVAPIYPDEGASAAFRLVKLTGIGDDIYDVTRYDEGYVACTCASYEYRLKGLSWEPCKHGKALAMMGLIACPMPPLPGGRGGDEDRRAAQREGAPEAPDRAAEACSAMADAWDLAPDTVGWPAPASAEELRAAVFGDRAGATGWDEGE
jgi:hypothetical protein